MKQGVSTFINMSQETQHIDLTYLMYLQNWKMCIQSPFHLGSLASFYFHDLIKIGTFDKLWNFIHLYILLMLYNLMDDVSFATSSHDAHQPSHSILPWWRGYISNFITRLSGNVKRIRLLNPWGYQNFNTDCSQWTKWLLQLDCH